MPKAIDDFIEEACRRVAADNYVILNALAAHGRDSDLALVKAAVMAAEMILGSLRFPHQVELSVLRTIASEQESELFWLHRQGLTAKEMALRTHLTEKDVERILSRLLPLVESKLKGIHPESSKRPIK